ncbi:MAG: hypothetical protein Q8T09_22740 [Candidatus Melainabacteria bacterium]|nr:hypothetical protein [Candidatus Melainabacteria bacterium]
MKIKSLLPITAFLAISFSVSDALALSPKLERYDTSAQRSFEQSDYKRAQSQWDKLRLELEKSREGLAEAELQEQQAAIEKTLRRMGECSLQMKNFSSASDFFDQAKAALPAGSTDPDLDKDITQLSSLYRMVEPSSFGSEVAKAFKDVGAEKISIAKTDDGHHIEIVLSEKVVKPIDQKGVSEVGFDKTISFDLSEKNEGEIRIDRITGLKVHAQFWVNVIASKLRKNEAQEPVAEVTGEKMGISQSVSSKLPDQIYQPILALVNKVRNVFGESATQDIATGSATQSAGGSGSSTGISSGSMFSNGINSGALPGSVIPASNTGNSGAIVPLVNDQPMENNGNDAEK